MASNPFLDVSEILKGNDELSYINYSNFNESNKEFLRNDVWDFTWTQAPAAVYFPGNDLLKARMRSVSPQFPTQLSQMQTNIRQFTIQQSVFSGSTAGTLSLEYCDREDQAITAWLDDWRDKIGGRENRFAFRKEDLVGQGELVMFNSSRKRIRTYTIYTIQLQDMGQGISPQFGSDDAQNIGETQASFSFEHFEMKWENI